MKKIIFALALVLIGGGSFYAVNTYNKGNSNQQSKSEVNQKQDSNSSKESSDTGSAANKLKISLNDPLVNKSAPAFKLKDLDGKEVSLSDFKGKKVFLNFWATWCPPCRSEMPHIEQLYKETKDSDLVILAVDLGEDKDTVSKFLTTNKYNFKVLLDSDTNTANNYNVSGIPTSYFINKDGIIRAKKVGAMSFEEMKDYVNALNK